MPRNPYILSLPPGVPLRHDTVLISPEHTVSIYSDYVAIARVRNRVAELPSIDLLRSIIIDRSWRAEFFDYFVDFMPSPLFLRLGLLTLNNRECQDPDESKQ